MQPLVSVVIPTYNCLDYLSKAIGSVLEQDLEELEILVMDDGSTDGTFAWLEKIAEQHPQIVPVRLEHVGVVAARNHAIEMARSEYIAFLDADDYWLPGKLKCQLNWHMASEDHVLSFTNYMHFNEEGKEIIDCFGYWKVFNHLPNANRFFELDSAGDEILATNMIGTSTVVARRDALLKVGGFSSELKSTSDWDMWLKLAQCGKVSANPRIQMQYLMRAGSITSNRLNRLEAMRRIITGYINRYPASDKACELAWSRLEEGYAEYHREQGEAKKALRWDWVSLRRAPEFRKLKHLSRDLYYLMRSPSRAN